MLNIQEKFSQLQKPDEPTVDRWKAMVENHRLTPLSWGNWGCRAWTGRNRKREAVDYEFEHGRQRSEVFNSLFNELTTPALTFDGSVVHGETDVTLLIIRPPHYDTLRQAAALGWSKDKIIDSLPHIVSHKTFPFPDFHLSSETHVYLM